MNRQSFSSSTNRTVLVIGMAAFALWLIIGDSILLSGCAFCAAPLGVANVVPSLIMPGDLEASPSGALVGHRHTICLVLRHRLALLWDISDFSALILSRSEAERMTKLRRPTCLPSSRKRWAHLGGCPLCP